MKTNYESPEAVKVSFRYADVLTATTDPDPDAGNIGAVDYGDL